MVDGCWKMHSEKKINLIVNIYCILNMREYSIKNFFHEQREYLLKLNLKSIIKFVVNTKIQYCCLGLNI